MNFLAHLYLTKDLPEEISIGNFIADSVKGKKSYLNYPLSIQIGIDIHREIDQYSDSHPLFRTGTKRLHESYGKYASIIMDIYYDHILAISWEKYHDIELNEFASQQYVMIEKNLHLLPEFTKYWFNIMKNENLLYVYASESGIHDVLKRMDQRTDFVSGMGNAINELITFKKEYNEEFSEFFNDMQLNLRNKFPDLWAL